MIAWCKVESEQRSNVELRKVEKRPGKEAGKSLAFSWERILIILRLAQGEARDVCPGDSVSPEGAQNRPNQLCTKKCHDWDWAAYDTGCRQACRPTDRFASRDFVVTGRAELRAELKQKSGTEITESSLWQDPAINDGHPAAIWQAPDEIHQVLSLWLDVRAVATISTMVCFLRLADFQVPHFAGALHVGWWSSSWCSLPWSILTCWSLKRAEHMHVLVGFRWGLWRWMVSSTSCGSMASRCLMRTNCGF